MKFVNKWPNAQVGDEPAPGGMFKHEKGGPCVMCKQRTRWVSLNWMAPLCSEECEERLKKGYEASLNPEPDFWTQAEENNNES